MTTPRDVSVADAARTPVGKHGGGLSGVRPEDLAAHGVRSLAARAPRLGPGRVDGVFFGDTGGAGEDNRDIAACGGAEASGHPPGAPGTRVAGAVAHRLAAKGPGTGPADPCTGAGQGLALVMER